MPDGAGSVEEVVMVLPDPLAVHRAHVHTAQELSAIRVFVKKKTQQSSNDILERQNCATYYENYTRVYIFICQGERRRERE